MTTNFASESQIVGSLRSVDGAGVVHLEVRFDTGVDAVWAALTHPEHLGQWLGELEGDLGPGHEFRARFFATGWEGTCRVDVCEAPARLRVLTRSDGEPDCIIEVRLVADGDQARAVFEDRGLPLEHIAAYGAGDQVLLEDLAAHLAGQARCDARARWQELHPDYQDLAAELT